MTVILDQYPVIEKGTFEIRQMVTIQLSAEEARRKVARWLRMEVSNLLGADAPTLVVGKGATWRVPAHFSAPQVGVVGQVGEIEVDAVTGEMRDLAACAASIRQRRKRWRLPCRPFSPTNIYRQDRFLRMQRVRQY